MNIMLFLKILGFVTTIATGHDSSPEDHKTVKTQHLRQITGPGLTYIEFLMITQFLERVLTGYTNTICS